LKTEGQEGSAAVIGASPTRKIVWAAHSARPESAQLAGLQRCGRRSHRDSQPEAGILNAKESGADTQIRTADLLFTKQLLYR
jgi:hypothetical protein